MAARNLFVKVALGFVALGILSVLFAASLRDVASEPYTVRAADLGRWTVELDARATVDGPLLMLRPPAALTMGLFDQVFQRTMASFTTPADPGIPLVLRGEFERWMAETISLDELVQLARDAGLETATLEPGCMSVHRTVAGREQQQFFVLFDLPAFTRFRQEVAQLVRSRGDATAEFDPDALSPALLVASSEAGLFGQIPARAALEQDCEAPVTAG